MPVTFKRKININYSVLQTSHWPTYSYDSILEFFDQFFYTCSFLISSWSQTANKYTCWHPYSPTSEEEKNKKHHKNMHKDKVLMHFMDVGSIYSQSISNWSRFNFSPLMVPPNQTKLGSLTVPTSQLLLSNNVILDHTKLTNHH